jgi:adenylate cyclase
MSWWARSRLRTKIFLAFSVLILILLLSTLWLTQLVVSQQVQSTLRSELRTTGQVFQGLVIERAARLLTNTTLLAEDFALKRVIATYDPSTLASVAFNYRQRIGVDLLWITDERGVLLADSRGRQPSGQELTTVAPLAEALASGEASAAIAEVNGMLLQLIAVPVLAPDVIGFLLLGEEINDNTAQQLQEDTGSHISFLTQDRLLASSWSLAERNVLFPDGKGIPEFSQHPLGETFLVTRAGERFLSLVVPIEAHLPLPLYALVQRSYDKALGPLYVLRRRILLIGTGAIMVALFIGIGLAGGITAPVQTLVMGMQEILRGNLRLRLTVRREDEIGFLARSFNEMVAGLEEREQIRDVMQKVVSPEVAHELLQHGVTLGGEVREVSVLFADIRSFTSFSETLPPPELLQLLNAYFSCVSRVIEREKGIIDKYIGDEVMAIFGAPLYLADHARRAVSAAVGMLQELERFNTERRQLSPLRIGIGIASGPVVAGNVGSPARLNYTVLGDTVNVASRLQGLTKEYGVPLILCGTTYAQVSACFSCRSLGRVAVRGRQQETVLYTVELSRDFV